MNNLHCSIKIHTDTMRETEASDAIHMKKITQTNVKHKLTLKCFLFLNVKFMILAFNRFELAFSSSVSCIPLAFLKNTSVGRACNIKFDDINDSVYKCFDEYQVCLIIYISNKGTTPFENKLCLFIVFLKYFCDPIYSPFNFSIILSD